MLKVRNLTKRLHGRTIINNLTFQVVPGEIFGLLGPNGAGKTTVVKMITGLITPSSGVIELEETNLAPNPFLAKQLIGYVPEGTPFYPEMKVVQFLNFIAEIRGLRATSKYQRLAELIQQIQLEEFLEQRIQHLSNGNRSKLAIAQALIHDPKILILDEPTDGLDYNQRIQIHKLIQTLAKDKSIILATRSIGDIEAICDRVAIMAHGKIVIDSTPETLAQQSPLHNCLDLSIEASAINETALINMMEALQTLSDIGQIEKLTGKRNELILRLHPKEKFISTPKINKLAKDLEWPILDLQLTVGRLEEVFQTITARYKQMG